MATKKKTAKRKTKKKVAKRKTTKKKTAKRQNPELLDRILRKKRKPKNKDLVEVKVDGGSLMITGSEALETAGVILGLVNQSKDELQIEFIPGRKGKKTYILSKSEEERSSSGGYGRFRRGRR